MRNISNSVQYKVRIMKTTTQLSTKVVTCIMALLFFAATAEVTASSTNHDKTYQNRYYGHIQPSVAHDFNRERDVVEVVLIASEQTLSLGTGKRTKVWTYNGGIPGPTIQGKVGDTLIVHFFNHLPVETTIHWHGVEVPANMDGSNIAQKNVPPGGSFRYEFKLLRAATYWYHPHINTNVSVEKGLYGALIIRDPAEDRALGLPTEDHVLVLDDMLLDDHGQIAAPFPNDPLENALVQVNGREGNTFLVNGDTQPKANVRRGVPQRLRLVNVSNSRFMRISIPGHRMWRIGGDGGLLETPIDVQPITLIPNPDEPGTEMSDPDPSKGILLTPGERADVVFTPQGNGPLKVEWHDIPRGRHSAFFKPDGTIGLGDAPDDGKRPPQTLLTFHRTGNPHGGEYIPPAKLRSITPIDDRGADPIPVTFGHTPPNATGDITFFVARKNVMPLPFPTVTSADAPTVTVGETRVWEVTNLTGGDHNFHPHGFMFQLIETEFIDLDNPDNNAIVPASHLEVKDTIRIPRRPGAPGRSRTITRLAVTFTDTGREGQVEAFGKEAGEDTSGGWVFHCHILEHADRGMMSFFQVRNP